MTRQAELRPGEGVLQPGDRGAALYCRRRLRKSPKLGWDLFHGAGQGPAQRRKRIGPQPQKNQATGSQQDHGDRKGRRIGMKPVEARPAQRRTNADTERKNPKHGPIEFCVITQPEIAVGEERHQVDLGANAEPADDSAEKRRKPCGTARQDADADHR